MSPIHPAARSSSHYPLPSPTCLDFDDWMYFEHDDNDNVHWEPYDDPCFLPEKAAHIGHSNPWSSPAWEPTSSPFSPVISPIHSVPRSGNHSRVLCTAGGDQEPQFHVHSAASIMASSARGTHSALASTASSAFSNGLPRQSQHKNCHTIPMPQICSASTSPSSPSPGGAFYGSSSARVLHEWHSQPALPLLEYSASVYSSSPSPPSSPDLSPPSVPILQPRPYRRIPIISLSEIASACDEWDHNSSKSHLETEKVSPIPSSPLAPGAFAGNTTADSTYRSHPFGVPHVLSLSQHPLRGSYVSSIEGLVCSCGCMSGHPV